MGIAAGAALIRYSELVTGSYLSAGVPPILAIALLLLLAALRPLARRAAPPLAVGRRARLVSSWLWPAAFFVCAQQAARAFLPHVLPPSFWGPRQPPLARFRGLIPGWFAPIGRAHICTPVAS